MFIYAVRRSIKVTGSLS